MLPPRSMLLLPVTLLQPCRICTGLPLASGPLTHHCVQLGSADRSPTGSWYPPYPREIPCRYSERAVMTRLLAVPGDSTRVERLMDCSKLPDSVTGVNEIGMPEGETLRAIL